MKPKQDAEINALNFGANGGEGVLEEEIHAYLTYNLVRFDSQLKHIFGSYTQVLREVPISSSGQHRADLMLLYNNPQTGKESVFTIIEIKRGKVSSEQLKQLLSYLKVFPNRLGLEDNMVEGIYIGSDFDQIGSDYVKVRSRIEMERRIQLMKYQITDGKLKLELVPNTNGAT